MTTSTELREQIADLQHQQWAGWTEYMFSKCTKNEDGTLTIPTWAVERWTRQINTPYNQLSESEKDSDRVEAYKVLELFTQVLKSLEMDEVKEYSDQSIEYNYAVKEQNTKISQLIQSLKEEQQ